MCPATSVGYYWAHCFLPALWSQISFYGTVYSRNPTPSVQQTFSHALLFSPFAAVTGSATQSCSRQLEFTPPQGSALPHLQGDHKASAAILNRHNDGKPWSAKAVVRMMCLRFNSCEGLNLEVRHAPTPVLTPKVRRSWAKIVLDGFFKSWIVNEVRVFKVNTLVGFPVGSQKVSLIQSYTVC